jgi:hypothetical protein
MNIRINSRPQGSVLVVGLLTALVVAITLASYLVCVSNESYAVTRSQAWNAAVPIMEAGVEEALTQIYYNGAQNMSTNNWTLGSDGYYRKTRTVGTNGSYCQITIQPTNYPSGTTNYVIYSTGYVPAPLSSSSYVARKLRVTTQVAAIGTNAFPFAVVTATTLTLGSGFIINSYDDSLPWPWTNSNVGAQAGLASTSTTNNQITISGTTYIYGTIATPPSGGVSISGTGVTIGDSNYVANPANAGTTQSNHILSDLNYTIPGPPTPTNTSSWATPVAYGQTSYTNNGIVYNNSAGWAFVLKSNNYNMGTTLLKGGVLVLGSVNLYVPSNGRIQFGSGDVLSIPQSANGSLTLYNDSTTDAVMKDSSNDSGIPSKFIYYGLPDTAGSKITLTGSGAFAYVGIIDAPWQKLVLTGASSGNQDFFGAIAVNNFTESGHAFMHYPKSFLGSGGPGGGYVVSTLNEVNP